MSLRRRSVVVVPGARRAAAARLDALAGELAPFDPEVRAELWWRQPRRFRQEWRLEADGRAVAVMQGEPLFSRVSRVRFAGAAYAAKRGWTGSVELRAGDAMEPIARLAARWSASPVEAPAGDTLRLVRVGFWGRVHELRTADDHVLVRLESHEGLTRHEVQVLLEDPARRRPDLPALLALAAAVVFAPKRHSS